MRNNTGFQAKFIPGKGKGVEKPASFREWRVWLGLRIFEKGWGRLRRSFGLGCEGLGYLTQQRRWAV